MELTKIQSGFEYQTTWVLKYSEDLNTAHLVNELMKVVIQAISHAIYYLNNELLVCYLSHGLNNGTIQRLNKFGPF